MKQVIVDHQIGRVVAYHPVEQHIEHAYPSSQYSIILREKVPDDWTKDPRVGDELNRNHDTKIRNYLKPRNRHEVLFRKLAEGLENGDTTEFQNLVKRTFG